MLAACVTDDSVSRKAPQAISLADSGVVVAGPPGYCIDRAGSRINSRGGAFVLLGSCASIVGSPRVQSPDTPALLTVTVSEAELAQEEIEAQLDQLAGFFATSDGRATLSRSGNAADVDLLQTRLSGGILYLHASDRSGAEKGIAPEYWRALFAVRDRLLSVSVVGFADRPLTADNGLRTLDNLAERIRLASGGAG